MPLTCRSTRTARTSLEKLLISLFARRLKTRPLFGQRWTPMEPISHFTLPLVHELQSHSCSQVFDSFYATVSKINSGARAPLLQWRPR